MINRGNDRRDLFAGNGAAESFQPCLFEAEVKFGWRLHAFVIMRNHVHRAVETPLGFERARDRVGGAIVDRALLNPPNGPKTEARRKHTARRSLRWRVRCRWDHGAPIATGEFVKSSPMTPLAWPPQTGKTERSWAAHAVSGESPPGLDLVGNGACITDSEGRGDGLVRDVIRITQAADGAGRHSHPGALLAELDQNDTSSAARALEALVHRTRHRIAAETQLRPPILPHPRVGYCFAGPIAPCP